MASGRLLPARFAQGWRVIELLALPYLALSLIAIGDARGGSLPEVLDAWRARQKAVGTLSYDWTQEELIVRGSIPQPPEGELPQPDPGAVIPPADALLVSRFLFRLRDGDARYAEDAEIWSPNKNERARQKYEVAFFADENRELFPAEAGDFPIATTSKKPPSRALTNHRNLVPLRLAFRPLDPGFNGMDEAKLEMEGDRSVSFNGSACSLVNYLEFEGMVHEIWVDNMRDFVPVRCISRRNGQQVVELSISYGKEGEYWVPTSWIRKQMGLDGTLLSQYTASVFEHLINAPMSDADFAVEFPDGTWVYDRSAREEHVILRGGEKRTIKNGEGASDYETIMRESAFWSPQAVLIVVTISVAIASLVILAIWRWKSHH